MTQSQDNFSDINREVIERGLVFIELKAEVSERLELPGLVPIFREDLERELGGGQIPPSAIAAGIEALKLLKPDLEEYNRFLARYYLLEGQKAIEQNDNYQAQRYYTKTLELDQDTLSAEAAFYLARLLSADDPTEAERLYQDSIGLNPQAASAHFELALLLRERRDLPGALAEFEAAYRLEPESANLLNEVGDTHVLADNLAQAIVAYRQASALEPEYWILPVKLGMTEYNLNLFSDAIKDLRVGLEMSPDELDSEYAANLYIEGLYYLGLAYRESGKPEQARKLFRAVLNLAPDHPGTLEAMSQEG